MNKKHRIVYRMDYALILQEKGHKIAGVMPNYNTWIFERWFKVINKTK